MPHNNDNYNNQKKLGNKKTCYIYSWPRHYTAQCRNRQPQNKYVNNNRSSNNN